MSEKLRDLFLKHRDVMAHLEVRDGQGDHSSGSAFHIGEGVFVTARHAVEGKTVTAITLTECCAEPLRLIGEPLYHPDPTVDVAVLRVANVHRLQAVPLGSHLDDWLADRDWVLTSAVVLGYPPIPFTNKPVLVAATAELHCVVDLRNRRHPLFILSAIPRGGFSGGLVISERGFALGVVTESLVRNGAPAETGFFGCLTVEPIYECLAHHKVLPELQREGWDDFWNSELISYGLPTTGGGIRVTASLCAFDDGVSHYLEVSCDNGELRDAVVRSLLATLRDASSKAVNDARAVRISISNAETLADAQKLADALLKKAGLHSAEIGKAPTDELPS